MKEWALKCNNKRKQALITMEFKLTRNIQLFLFITSSDDNKRAQQVYFMIIPQ